LGLGNQAHLPAPVQHGRSLYLLIDRFWELIVCVETRLIASLLPFKNGQRPCRIPAAGSFFVYSASKYRKSMVKFPSWEGWRKAPGWYVYHQTHIKNAGIAGRKAARQLRGDSESSSE